MPSLRHGWTPRRRARFGAGSTEVLGLYGLMIGCDSVLMWNFVAVCVKVLIASAYLPSGKTGKGTSSKSSVKSETQVPFSFETAWPE